MKYRRKGEVEAIQGTGDNAAQIESMTGAPGTVLEPEEHYFGFSWWQKTSFGIWIGGWMSLIGISFAIPLHGETAPSIAGAIMLGWLWPLAVIPFVAYLIARSFI
jgi:hypothetical protein